MTFSKKYSKTIFIFVLTLMNVFVFTINSAMAKNTDAARYEIDAKRIGVTPTSKDAMPRSREFIRLDSTYYVGWMFEGIYKYDRSSDYLGFKYAIPSLEKALNLFEKDYGNELKHIYSSIQYYSEHTNKMADFFEVVYALENCYNSIEMPDSVMTLLDRVEKYNFQKDYFGTYNDRAWTYHRSRFLTSSKYDFLKNSVEENEKMAFNCCYKQLSLIEKNKSVNDFWYGANQSTDDILKTYHYLALLHNYNQHYDSAEFYYQKLVEGNRVLWGNYGGMQNEIGNFDKAIEYFAKPQFTREHSARLLILFLHYIFMVDKQKMPLLWCKMKLPEVALLLVLVGITLRWHGVICMMGNWIVPISF
jgi:tetratricopeptide (TPR) repeat protein